MNNKNYRFAGGFVLLAVAVFAVAVVLHGREADAPGAVGGLGANNEGAAQSISGASDDRIIANASSGYVIAVPANWYVETSSAELAVYPDYDPANASTTPASCKLEISSFATPRGTDLGAWVTKYLHEDPTASVVEISREPIAVGEASGEGASGAPLEGLEWRGVLNNVTTTLVYIEEPGNSITLEKIFEIAPSTLSEAGDADNDDCDLDLQALVANFTITNDEP